MHEAALIRGAVQEALARMREVGGVRITHVVLTLGASGHFSEDTARQHFVLNALGTPIEDAALEIEWLPASYQCIYCLRLFESAESPDVVVCPTCGGSALEIGHADMCYVREIEVERPSIAGAFAVQEPMPVDLVNQERK